MSQTTSTPPQHPLLRFAAALDQALDRLGDPDPVYLAPEEQKRALLALAREEERLRALRLRVQGVAEDVASQAGAKDAGMVLASEARRDRRRTAADQHLAEALEQRWNTTGQAWREGRLNGDQAVVIAAALDKLPDDLAPELLAKAEDHLIDQAALYGPVELRRLGDRLWEVIAPDEADEQLRLALEAEERNAEKATRLTLKPMGDGSTRISGRIPDAAAKRLAALLEAHTSPRRDHLTGDVRDAATGARLPYEQLRGQAFCTLVEHADPDRLPQHGQTATTLVITMELDKLRAATGAGTLLDDTGLSAGEIRRLACNAHLVPIVLGTDSEILDQGRASRLFTRPQRLAMAVRDRHCRAAGCTVPAPWCEAHHLDPWTRNGKTNLADGALLCPFHHHRIHDNAYRHQRHGDGTFTFHRRT
jgi:hypothetical protein